MWYDLGTLYESCGQIADSLITYQRAANLDANNKHIQQRLAILRQQQKQQAAGGGFEPTSHSQLTLVRPAEAPREKPPLLLGPEKKVFQPMVYSFRVYPAEKNNTGEGGFIK